MTYKESHDKYSKYFKDELTQEDHKQAGDFLSALSSAEMNDWSEARTKISEVNGQRFRMVVDRPDDGDSNHAVVVGGEFGNGISPWAVARARVVRDLVAPEAALIYQPNTTLDQPNMNFSRDERRELYEGRPTPLIGRLGLVLSEIDAPEDLTFYGPSQGGVMSLGYATSIEAPAAVAVLETPNVADRSKLKLVKDFAGSGAQLKDVIRENYDDPDSLFMQETIAALSLAGMARFVAGLVHPDNRALTGILRRSSAKDQIATILKNGGSVVQAYGTVNNVSPESANTKLAEVFAGNQRYRAIRLENADHSITNHYPLSGALARTARRLLQQ